MTHNPLICAIDVADFNTAYHLSEQLAPDVGAVKIGLEFFCANNREAVEKIVALGVPVFLDLKLHDIPNTVASAIKAISGLGVAMTTLHALGGKEMLSRAVEAHHEECSRLNKPQAKLLAVTILTSMDDAALSEAGIATPVQDQVLRLAGMALSAGVDGLVCSPWEIELLKREFGNDLMLVTPGIRPKAEDKGDQKRIMTPGEAIKLGADYIVVGRPITTAKNPVQAAKNIVTAIDKA